MADYDVVSCYRINRQDNARCGRRQRVALDAGHLTGLIFAAMNLRDVDCAFKLYKREIFDHIKMESTGALIDTEILARSVA